MQRALASYKPEPGLEHFTQVSFIDAETGRPPADLFQPQDKRGSPRRRVLLSALVVNHEFNTIFRCQVRDVSDQGAKLSIPDCFLVPAGFWLIAMSEGQAYQAQLAWRRHPSAGVSLSDAIELETPTTPVAHKLRAVWMNVTS